MITTSDLIQHARSADGLDLKVAYAHPLIYVLCISDSFQEVDPEERIRKLAAMIDVPEPDILRLTARGALHLAALTSAEHLEEYGFLDDLSQGRHWLEWFGRIAAEEGAPSLSAAPTSSSPRVLHFYGLKGGQARSTVLLLLAKSIADLGMRCLVVDADLEAPSLDAALDVAADDPASTLMGIAGWADDFRPISNVYVGEDSRGAVDLVACRPRSQSFDVDFAGFLLACTLDARVLLGVAQQLRALSEKAGYDYVLVDHRTGLAPSVLPLVDGWPGAAVIFARPDGMSANLEPAVSALLGRDTDSPGAFVTFSLDPKETPASLLERNGRFVERLLERMSDAISGDTTAIDPAELERFWILWCHDPTVIAHASPAPSEVAARNRAALAQLRDVLAIRGKEIRPSAPALSKSGAADEGVFILTPDLARLFSSNSGIIYVSGRKGTGKTRLLRELHSRGLGEPLLVAQDYRHGGLQSGLALFASLLDLVGDAERFWYALLAAGIRASGNDGASLEEEVRRITSLSPSDRLCEASLGNLETQVQSLDDERRIFLIDGVETAVPAARLSEFVEGLFRFMASVQFSRVIASKVTVRLFIRTDLQKAAAQNVEQQVEGRSLDLRWDLQSILNFAVARLGSLEWFREVFPVVCSEIDRRIPELSRGALESAEAEALLLKVFPEGLDRNRVKTTTFLATYFSDAGGDLESRAAFYPRLFDGFLRKLNDRAASGEITSQPTVEGRLSSPLVLACYDDASKEFLDEVRSELQNLLDLDADPGRNQAAVNRLIESFRGMKTPFIVDQTVAEIAIKSEISAERVRESLTRMKRLGMFEDRPGFPGSWRTGRLYKAGLNMKYVRAGSSRGGKGS